jgi:hypothetical protein
MVFQNERWFRETDVSLKKLSATWPACRITHQTELDLYQDDAQAANGDSRDKGGRDVQIDEQIKGAIFPISDIFPRTIIDQRLGNSAKCRWRKP